MLRRAPVTESTKAKPIYSGQVEKVEPRESRRDTIECRLSAERELPMRRCAACPQEAERPHCDSIEM